MLTGWMDGWMDTPQTVTTTRAPAVLKIDLCKNLLEFELSNIMDRKLSKTSVM